MQGRFACVLVENDRSFFAEKSSEHHIHKITQNSHCKFLRVRKPLCFRVTELLTRLDAYVIPLRIKTFTL